VMQKDTKIYPGSGKRRPYVQRGRRVCIILHLSACTGVNTSAVWNEVEYGSSTAYVCSLAWYGTRTYSRPPYRRGLEPSCPGSLMMITRAPVTRSVHRRGLVYQSHACTSWRQIRRSGCSVVIRCPTLPQEGNMSGRGSNTV